MCIVSSAMHMVTKSADCPDRIPPSGTPACHKRWHTRLIPDCPLDSTTGTDTGIAGQGHSYTLEDIEVTVAIMPAEVIPDHITDATTQALHDTITPALMITTVTWHTGDLHHVEAYQHTPEIIAGPSHAHYINPVRTPHLNPHPVPAGQ